MFLLYVDSVSTISANTLARIESVESTAIPESLFANLIDLLFDFSSCDHRVTFKIWLYTRRVYHRQ